MLRLDLKRGCYKNEGCIVLVGSTIGGDNDGDGMFIDVGKNNREEIPLRKWAEKTKENGNDGEKKLCKNETSFQYSF